MTTVAVDTNVLLSILYDDTHGDDAETAVRAGYRRGRLVVTGVVYAELAAAAVFDNRSELDRFLEDTSIAVVTASPEARYHAGEAFDTYTNRRPDGLQCPACGTEQTATCEHCGRDLTPRQHVAADFLMGTRPPTPTNCSASTTDSTSRTFLISAFGRESLLDIFHGTTTREKPREPNVAGGAR